MIALNLKTSAQNSIEIFWKLANPEKKANLIKANFGTTFKGSKEKKLRPATLNSFVINSLSLQTSKNKFKAACNGVQVMIFINIILKPIIISTDMRKISKSNTKSDYFQ